MFPIDSIVIIFRLGFPSPIIRIVSPHMGCAIWQCGSVACVPACVSDFFVPWTACAHACARITFNVFYGIRIGSGNSLPSHHLVIKINECCLYSCASKSTRTICSLEFVCMCVYIPVNMKKYFSRRQNLPKVLTSILMGYFCMINSFIRHCFLLPLQPVPTRPLSLSLPSHSNVICLSHSFKITLIYIFPSFHLIMHTIVCACGIFTYIEVKGKPGNAKETGHCKTDMCACAEMFLEFYEMIHSKLLRLL